MKVVTTSLDTKIKLSIIFLFLLFDAYIYYANSTSINFSYLNGIDILPLLPALVIALLLVIIFDQFNGEILIYHSLALSLLMGVIMTAYCYLAPASPFNLIDEFLHHADLSLGIDTPTIVSWVQTHVLLNRLLNFCYDSLIFELTFTFLVLGIFARKQELKMFMLSLFIVNLVGALIFYFFPTIGTVTQFHNVVLPSLSYQLLEQYKNIRAHLPITNYFVGIISFPSFHVIIAVFIIYYHRKIPTLFYPLLIWNCLVIISTLTIGWHYAVDLLGGFILASIAIVVTHWVFQRYPKNLQEDFLQLNYPLPQIAKWKMTLLQLSLLVSILMSTYWQTWFVYVAWLIFILYWGVEWRRLNITASFP